MVEGPTGKRLETNWGSVFVSSFYNQVETAKPFIDNLSPSLAAVWWALRSEPARAFGLPQIGKLLVMLLRDQRALDNLGYLAFTLGPVDARDQAPSPPQTVENLVGLYEKADPALAQPLQDLLKDPEVHRDAVSALAELTDADWKGLRIEKATPELEGLIFRRDPYVQGAYQLVHQRPSIGVVVMGHTHELNAQVVALNEPREPPKWYVNTGCWQKNLAVKEARAKGWDKMNLDDPVLFPDRFSYVRVGFDAKGKAEKPLRCFWPADETCKTPAKPPG